jgi:Ubiquitin-activating enzyme active site
LLDEGENFLPTSQEDVKSLKDVVKLLSRRPKSFEDCLRYARLKFEKLFNHDVRQLLHVYPLDAKTKEGAPFWSLPKRPPTPVEYEAENPLHYQFISAIACLRATNFKVEIPSKTPRSEEFRKECGKLAAKFEVPKFVPNDEKAKEIQASVTKEE